MGERFSSERFRFLFRQDRGTIDASTWRSAAAVLAMLFVLAAAGEWLANRSGKAIGIGVTAIFILAAMLIAACWYFLSVKRFRDLKYPVTVKDVGEQARYLTAEELTELVRWFDALDRF